MLRETVVFSSVPVARVIDEHALRLEDVRDRHTDADGCVLAAKLRAAGTMNFVATIRSMQQLRSVLTLGPDSHFGV
jgi:hypothetical protein